MFVRLIEADADEMQKTFVPSDLTFCSKPELEKLLIEGIEGGGSREITAAEWDEKRRKLRDRHSKPGSR